MDRKSVSAAFEILLEEVQVIADDLNKEGATAFENGNYEHARELIDDATRLEEFRGKVRDLQKEWTGIFEDAGLAEKATNRKSYGRLATGLRTSEKAFRRPILRVLVKRGGSAPAGEVVEALEDRMRDQLNEYDREFMPSDPDTTRWEKSAHWCRYAMVNDGLLRDDSPRGIWEISDAGRKMLKEKL